MEENQKMTNQQLEAELSSHRSKATFAKVVTYGSGAMMILFFIMGLIPLALICLISALVGGYQLSKHTEALKKKLSENVVSGVLNDVFDNVEYDPFGRLPDEIMDNTGMVFPFSYERVRGSDHIKGIYKDLNIELSDVEFYHVEEQYNHEENRWEETEKKVFQGQWLVCDFGKELSSEVHLSENTKALRKQHKNDNIEMENEEFNDRFLVTAEDAQEAYYVLTPHMMDYILSAADKCGGEVYMTFLRDGKLHIAVKTGRDFFELGGSNVNIESLRQKFLGELHWFTNMIDELRMEETFYRKETSV